MLPNLEDLLKGVYLQPMDAFKTMNFTIENNVLPHLNQSAIYNPFDDIDNCFTLTHGELLHVMSTEVGLKGGQKDVHSLPWIAVSALQFSVK